MSSDIKQKLEIIGRVFDISEMQKIKPDKKSIQKYYQANKLAYSLLHTRSDRMYMGISRDGVYKEDDLLEAARTVERYIDPAKTKRILELATGRGATSAHLAAKYPNIEFEGVELSPGQLAYSQNKAKKLNNYHPVLGDYHELGSYPDASIDIVFVIEALCYSDDKARVLAEVKRVLKSGGVFIILDGYTKKPRSAMTKDEGVAVRLTEVCMAVGKFEEYAEFLRLATKSGFTIKSSEDVSQFILPTLYRFEHLARRFFARPKAARAVIKIFPAEFVHNAVPGFLMPELIKHNLACYYITVLRKN